MPPELKEVAKWCRQQDAIVHRLKAAAEPCAEKKFPSLSIGRLDGASDRPDTPIVDEKADEEGMCFLVAWLA